MLPRTLEPEAMDTPEEAGDYDAMDHSATNARFVADFLAARGQARGGRILDVGTGPGRIAITLGQADPAASIVGVDLAESMLALARSHIDAAGLSRRITCVVGDAKALPWPDGYFDAVISNTILHHIPDPVPALAEIARLTAPGGILFIRDLARPPSASAVAALVAQYAAEESPAARALFEASLHAALTLDEARDIIDRLGFDPEDVTMTSDRHWTWVRMGTQVEPPSRGS